MNKLFILTLILCLAQPAIGQAPNTAQQPPTERSLRLHSWSYFAGSALVVGGGAAILAVSNEVFELDSPQTVFNAAVGAILLGILIQTEAVTSLTKDIERRFNRRPLKIEPASQGLGLALKF